MQYLWFGGEDLDFPLGVPTIVSTTAAAFRAGFARCTVTQTAVSTVGMSKSSLFPGGAVTSCWLSFRAYCTSLSAGGTVRCIGLGLGGTQKGLFLGTASASPGKISLSTFDGTTTTVLASESGDSWVAAALRRFKIRLSNYGASATVDVYMDEFLLFTFSGDVTVSGVTGVDSIFLTLGAGSVNSAWQISEILVTDEDPYTVAGIKTHPVSGAGTTDDWTGTMSLANVCPTTISDLTPVSTNVTAKDEQANVDDLPSGVFLVGAFKVAARAAKSTGSSISKIKLGYNSGGTVSVGSGISVGNVYTTYERYDTQNPVGPADWDSANVNAIQLDVQSLT